jgi:hypothetical protein
LVALNLADSPRTDFITIDAHLNAAGHALTNSLDPAMQLSAETRSDERALLVPLGTHRWRFFDTSRLKQSA